MMIMMMIIIMMMMIRRRRRRRRKRRRRRRRTKSRNYSNSHPGHSACVSKITNVKPEDIYPVL
jgi:hypothetical protein